MTKLQENASALLREFKGENYRFGNGILDEAVGPLAAALGRRVAFVGRTASSWFAPIQARIRKSLEKAGVEVIDVVRSSAPNAPLTDVYRIHSHLVHKGPEAVVVADSGSGIDAVKAAAVLATLGDVEPEIDPFFGVGRVSALCNSTGRSLLPVLPVMTAASSAAHLTKYSNVTDIGLGQKKLIVDEAIVPPRSVFDYDLTRTQPMSLTLDGALDGISHCLEVFYGASPEDLDKVRRIAEPGIESIIRGLRQVKSGPAEREARTLLGLGTDLGGYAIMVGGTSGAHLNSFSLVDVLSHGRACALMNPYYTVFFAPAIEPQLRVVGEIYRRNGFLEADLKGLSGRSLGMTVARGMIALSRFLDFPTRLRDVKGLGREHIDRCLSAAKDPQLDMKLRNMPVPLHAGLVDAYMGPILEAAWTGDLSRIRNLEP